MFRTILAIVILWIHLAQARDGSRCLSDANLSGDNYYDACCPRGGLARVASVGDTGFLYYCDRPTGDLEPFTQDPAKHPQECATKCAADSSCKMSVYGPQSPECALYTDSPLSTTIRTELVYRPRNIVMIKADISVKSTPPVADCQGAIDEAVQQCKHKRDEWEEKYNTCEKERKNCNSEHDRCKNDRDDCLNDHNKCKDERDDCKKERSDCEERAKNCPRIPAENDVLDTKDLCPNHNGTEFYLPTPNGEQTKWRVYCHHDYGQVHSDAYGYMNSTMTPYRTLLASRHWDRGYRLLHWMDDYYTHGTLYNMKPYEAEDREKRISIYPRQSSNRNHVIARIDDQVSLRIG